MHAALTGGLEDTFRELRWDGWEQEVSVLGPDTGLSLYPPPFARSTCERSHRHDRGFPVRGM